MFDTPDGDEKPTFYKEPPKTTTNKPLVTNGLFGGGDLAETGKESKKNLNGIFDYEDSDEENNNNRAQLEESNVRDAQTK
mmetsp:Transcript_22120/g.21324  ORF Transcript_22120/g.21324 Transcript_22120/m.21324 type:complete len:80 (+) Transcript_22120:199-438(+)